MQACDNLSQGSATRDLRSKFLWLSQGCLIFMFYFYSIIFWVYIMSRIIYKWKPYNFNMTVLQFFFSGSNYSLSQLLVTTQYLHFRESDNLYKNL